MTPHEKLVDIAKELCIMPNKGFGKVTIHFENHKPVRFEKNEVFLAKELPLNNK